MEHAISQKRFTTRHMVRISILAVIGYILLMINVPVPIFPSFLEFDLANLPGILASISMGPLAGVAVELIKNIIKALLASQTVGVGELSNFICGVAIVVPIGLAYKKMPNVKGYVIGSVISVVTLIIVSSLSNYFLIIPAYAAVMTGGVDAILAMCAKVNANITDLKGYILFAVVPFNLLKGTIAVAAGYIMYKFVKPILNMDSAV